MMRILVCVLLLFGTLPSLADRKPKDVPPAPLPQVVVDAKKVFITNGGGSDLAFDAFYDEMKKWGRYEIVGSPNDADLIIELSYFVTDRGTHVWSSTNSYTGATQVYSTQLVDPQFVLTIYDAKSKLPVWSAVDHRRLARLERNRQKEIVNSAIRLIGNLKTRITTAK